MSGSLGGADISLLYEMGEFAFLFFNMQITLEIKNYLISEVLFIWPEQFSFPFQNLRFKFDVNNHVFPELDVHEKKVNLQVIYKFHAIS